jgi:hypothetical protein
MPIHRQTSPCCRRSSGSGQRLSDAQSLRLHKFILLGMMHTKGPPTWRLQGVGRDRKPRRPVSNGEWSGAVTPARPMASPVILDPQKGCKQKPRREAGFFGGQLFHRSELIQHAAKRGMLPVIDLDPAIGRAAAVDAVAEISRDRLSAKELLEGRPQPSESAASLAGATRGFRPRRRPTLRNRPEVSVQ